MKNSLSAAMGGLIVGAVIMLASHGMWHSDAPHSQRQVSSTSDWTASDEVRIQSVPTSEKESSVASAVTRRKVETQETKNSPEEAPALQSVESDSPTQKIDGSGHDVIVLEEPYRSMVTPRPEPETLTLPELFEAFAPEQRDEAWAYPMETGIGTFSSGRAADFKTTFEYIGCQSQYCTIAGIVYGGSQADLNSMFTEMTQSGWWQAFGGHATTGSNDGEAYRFVSIFARKPEFFRRK